jgi:molybdenum cofactor cytidylyltransferase
MRVEVLMVDRLCRRAGDRARRYSDPMRADPSSPVVLVLASGRGERFIASGGQGSKLQALLAGKPVLQWTLDAVRASGLPFHVEDAGHPGMGDSIAAAVRATRDARGWLVLPGDLPLVRAETLRAVAAALAGRDVVIPTYRGERGHPVGFSARCGEALAALSGPQGAASVVRAMGAVEMDVDDEGVVVDVDTVEALDRAEGLVRQRGAA